MLVQMASNRCAKPGFTAATPNTTAWSAQDGVATSLLTSQALPRWSERWTTPTDRSGKSDLRRAF